jgi:hypothetical protein
MKKLFVLLGSLAVIILLASCANPSSGVDDGAFTVSDETDFVSTADMAWAQEHDCEKNADNRYIYHKYILKETTEEEYKKYINYSIYYKDTDGSADNKFYTSCKEKVQQKLNAKEFSVYKKADSGLGYDTLILNSYPQ